MEKEDVGSQSSEQKQTCSEDD